MYVSLFLFTLFLCTLLMAFLLIRQVVVLHPLLGPCSRSRPLPRSKMSSTLEYQGLPPPRGLYHPQYEKEACGVGFIVNINGKASHKVSFFPSKPIKDFSFLVASLCRQFQISQLYCNTVTGLVTV